MDHDALTKLAQEFDTVHFLQGTREWLHSHPETRYETRMTRNYIQTVITLIAFQHSLAPFVDGQIHESRGGIWLDITFNPDFPRLLFRADFDALPMQEETGLDFASKNPGKMHACGHDVHTAMLLAFLRALGEGVRQGTVKPTHNLRVVFQDAEENPITESGGAMLVREGVLDGVASVYGLHIWATGENGVFLSRPGGFMANSDRVKVTVTGEHAVAASLALLNNARGYNEYSLGLEPCSFVPAMLVSEIMDDLDVKPLCGNAETTLYGLDVEVACSGGHVANPHQGSNALDILAHLFYMMRGLAVRVLGPNTPCTITPVSINCGTGSNIRPSSGKMRLVVSVSPHTQEQAEALWNGFECCGRVLSDTCFNFDVDITFKSSEILSPVEPHARCEMWFANRHLLEGQARIDFETRIAADLVYYALSPYHVGFKVDFIHGHPALVNNLASVAETNTVLMAAGFLVDTMERIFGGEDFALYLLERPGAFFMLGARGQGESEDDVIRRRGDHHQPSFNPDPDVFWRGVAYWLLLACS